MNKKVLVCFLAAAAAFLLSFALHNIYIKQARVTAIENENNGRQEEVFVLSETLWNNDCS